MTTTEVELLPPAVARDVARVEQLVRLVNEAYAAGEAGLWLPGTSRTEPGEIGEAIARGEMLAARSEGRLVGCASVRALDAGTADLAFLSVAPESWGTGVGRALVRAAEDLARRRRRTAMQLELLVPKGSRHPQKERLRAWYERLGYRMVRSAPFEQVAGHLAPGLATPCEFHVFRKPLTEAAPVAWRTTRPERAREQQASG